MGKKKKIIKCSLLKFGIVSETEGESSYEKKKKIKLYYLVTERRVVKFQIKIDLSET